MKLREMEFQIFDKHTGLNVGKPYKNEKRARARMDKLDNEYGGYRYAVRRIKKFVSA